MIKIGDDLVQHIREVVEEGRLMVEAHTEEMITLLLERNLAMLEDRRQCLTRQNMKDVEDVRDGWLLEVLGNYEGQFDYPMLVHLINTLKQGIARRRTELPSV